MSNYDHAEAFCIMPYECESCEHKTMIWNSRDGVTPFCAMCRGCEKAIMNHNMRAREARSSELPADVPYVWVSHSLESAQEMALAFWDKHGEQMMEKYDHLREIGKDGLIKSKVKEIYKDGASPRLITREEFLQSH